MFALSHIFAELEAAYCEAESIKRQDALIREEEEAGQLQGLRTAARLAADREKKARKKVRPMRPKRPAGIHRCRLCLPHQQCVACVCEGLYTGQGVGAGSWLECQPSRVAGSAPVLPVRCCCACGSPIPRAPGASAAGPAWCWVEL